MKIRVVVAGLGLAAAAVAFAGGPAQAQGLGPSNCASLPPGSIIATFAHEPGFGRFLNPGVNNPVVPGPAVPFFCNPHSPL